MATQVEEERQAKEFLKRAEVKTMKKDLQALREVDALKERDKIKKIKTLEEQLEEKRKVDADSLAEKNEGAGLAEVLGKNEGAEKMAEKDIKNYASEQERQQIFLLESQRLGLEKQIDEIEEKKDPALKLEKNNLLLQKGDREARLNDIIDQEKKLEVEQKFITEKEQATTINAQRKSLEQSRWDLDKKIQETEKKRWEAEKQTEDIDYKIAQIDKSSEQLVTEKNRLNDKILGIDRSLREIYSTIVAREEEKRRGKTQEQLARKEALLKTKSEREEKIQREQWSPTALKRQARDEGYLSSVPKPAREKFMKTSEAELEQRKKFLQDVESLSIDKSQQQQKESLANPASAPKTSVGPQIPAPPVPKKINK